MAEETVVTAGQQDSNYAVKNGIGSGKVLGSDYTDTLGAELGYGIDGKTEITLMGKKYVFAPVSFRFFKEANAELTKLSTSLLALGMVKPLASFSEVKPEDVTAIYRILNSSRPPSEFEVCFDLTMLIYSISDEHRAVIAKLLYFSISRWHKDFTEEDAIDGLDFSNMIYFLRLYFRKNIGVLDRFFVRIMELLPPVPELTSEDIAETDATTPEEIASMLGIVPVNEEPPQEVTPDETQTDAAETVASPQRRKP